MQHFILFSNRLHHTHPSALRGQLNTPCHHRCSADRPACASHMEVTYAQDTESVPDSDLCPGQLVCCSSHFFFPTFQTRAEVGPQRLADEAPMSSVTIASIVRLIFLSKGHALENLFGLDYIDIFIWTNVEVNMSIICGEQMPPLSPAPDNKEKLV